MQIFQLTYFTAIDSSGCLTDPTGLRIAEFPVEPIMAKMLISSNEFKVEIIGEWLLLS